MSGIRLVSIRLAGFRVFQSPFEISLRNPRGGPSDVVVISGPNGTGKTSLLEAILLALDRGVLIQQTLVADVAKGHWRAMFPEAGNIILEFDIESAPGTELGVYAPCLVRLHRNFRGGRIEVVKDGTATPLPDQICAALLEYITVEYFSSWRGAFQLGGVRASTTLTEIPQDERYRFYRLKQRIINERSARGFSDRATSDELWLSRLNDMWGSWHDSYGTKLDALETGDPERPFDMFIVKDSEYGLEQICSLDMASSGELEWVTLAGTLITSNFEGLLLIDEPELHLHPQWQARLLPTLQRLVPRAQLIVATHSSYPWDQALPYQRVLLLPPGDPRRVEEEGSK